MTNRGAKAISLGDLPLRTGEKTNGQRVILDHGIEDHTARQFFRNRVLTHDGRDAYVSRWNTDFVQVRRQFDLLTASAVYEIPDEPETPSPVAHPEGWGRFG